jgi:hypothetical protein
LLDQTVFAVDGGDHDFFIREAVSVTSRKARIKSKA